MFQQCLGNTSFSSSCSSTRQPKARNVPKKNDDSSGAIGYRQITAGSFHLDWKVYCVYSNLRLGAPDYGFTNTHLHVFWGINKGRITQVETFVELYLLGICMLPHPKRTPIWTPQITSPAWDTDRPMSWLVGASGRRVMHSWGFDFSTAVSIEILHQKMQFVIGNSSIPG